MMKNRMILLYSFFGLAFCTVVASAQTIAVESINDDELGQLINRVKQISVSDLDPGLPRIALDQWLQEQSGGVNISWTLHYTDEPFDDEDIPPSIAADVNTQDGRWIAILIAVGLRGKVGNIKPYVYRIDEGRMASLIPAGEDKRPFSFSLRRLRDLPLALCMEEEAKVLEVDE
jgi:hypothetical protein